MRINSTQRILTSVLFLVFLMGAVTTLHVVPTYASTSQAPVTPDGGGLWDRFKLFIAPPEWLPAPIALYENTLFASSKSELVVASIEDNGAMTETLRQDLGSMIWDIKVADQKLFVATENGVLVGTITSPNKDGTLIFSQPGLSGHLVREITVLASDTGSVYFALVSPDLGLVLAQQFGNDPPSAFFRLDPTLTGAKHVAYQSSSETDKGTVITSSGAGISIISVDLSGSAPRIGIESTLTTGDEVRALAVSNNVAYWAVNNTLFALQLPSTQLFSLPLKLGGTIEDIKVSVDGKKLYVSNGLRGISVVDITNTSKPSILTTYSKFGAYALSSSEYGDVTIASFTTKLVTFDRFRKVIDELSINRLK